MSQNRTVWFAEQTGYFVATENEVPAKNAKITKCTLQCLVNKRLTEMQIFKEVNYQL
jgi:hypothetical protein